MFVIAILYLVHDFRWLAIANFAQWGAWIMDTLIQGWLVLQLTGSAAART